MGSAKIMISVPEEMLSELDHKAKEDHRSRSEFIREAVRHFLELKKAPMFLVVTNGSGKRFPSRTPWPRRIHLKTGTGLKKSVNGGRVTGNDPTQIGSAGQFGGY